MARYSFSSISQFVFGVFLDAWDRVYKKDKELWGHDRIGEKRSKFRDVFCTLPLAGDFEHLWNRKVGTELALHLLKMCTFGSKASFLFNFV